MLKTCIKCGYVRQTTDPAPDYECPKCGVIYAKAEAALANGTFVPSRSSAKVVHPEPETIPSKLGDDPVSLIGNSGDDDLGPTENNFAGAAGKKTANIPLGRRILVGFWGSAFLIVGVGTFVHAFIQGFTVVNTIGGAILIVLGINGWLIVLGVRAFPGLDNLTPEVILEEGLKPFAPTQQVLSVGKLSLNPLHTSRPLNGLAINDITQKIALISITVIDDRANRRRRGHYSHRIVDYKDVVSVELFVDQKSISKTDRMSQLGGAIAGNLLLGGVGTLIGGLSGKTETNQQSKRIELRLSVNDTVAPLHDVVFMDLAMEGGKAYGDKAMQIARHWNGIIEAVMKQAVNEERRESNSSKGANIQISTASVEPPKVIAQTSIADELKKLADLHSSGSLTSEEFKQLKVNLLSSEKK